MTSPPVDLPSTPSDQRSAAEEGSSSGRSYLALTLMGAAIGIPAALLAAAFFVLVRVVQDWLWNDLPSLLGFSAAPWFLIVGLPVIGALLVVFARASLPGDGGHSPLRGLDPSPTALAHAPGIVLAAIGSLSFGAVLGPEMPIIALGSVVGTAIGRIARVGPSATRVLAMAGSFSAISALFGGPLVAGTLLVEGGLAAGSRLLRILLPGLVAAAVGYTIFVGLGDWGGIAAGSLEIPDLPSYDGTTIPDLLAGLAVGLIAAMLVVGTRRSGAALERLGKNIPMAVLLPAGGLIIGLLAVIAGGLGVEPRDILFSGQTSIPSLVTQSSAAVVLVMLAGKAIAHAVSLGAGFRGGPIFPAVFLGVAVSSLGVVALGLSPTFAIATGAAAGVAAQTRLLFSPLLFAALLVGPAGADAMPAAVLATVASWLTVAAIDWRIAGEPGPTEA